MTAGASLPATLSQAGSGRVTDARWAHRKRPSRHFVKFRGLLLCLLRVENSSGRLVLGSSVRL